MVPSFVFRLFSFLLCVLCVLVVSCSPAPPPKPEGAPAETPPPVQETVSYLPYDKNIHGYLCRPGGIGKFPAVVLIHDSMGMTDAIKDAAFRLAQQDYVVLAVDLYHGHVPKDAERLPREPPKERVLRDLKAAVDYLSERDEVRPEQVVEQKKLSHVMGVVGLGMGGSYAFEAALADPRLRALVTCYGRLPTDPKRLATLKAPVFGIFAGKDTSITPDARKWSRNNLIAYVTILLPNHPLAAGACSSYFLTTPIAQFITAMNEAGKRIYAIRVYGECPHGFLDPANWPIYGKPPESDVNEAWDLIARYLDRILM